MDDRAEISATDVTRRLQNAIDDEQWAELATLITNEFFAALLVAPREAQAALDALPCTASGEYPKHLIAHAMLNASSQRLLVVDGPEMKLFRTWVDKQSSPETRDTLVLLLLRMQFFVAAGRHDDAGRSADGIQGVIDDATEWVGFQDLLPMTLMLMGNARLHGGDISGAIGNYLDSRWWAQAGAMTHPVYAHAGNYLALAYALNHQYVYANTHIAEWAGQHNAPEGTFAYRSENAGIYALAEIALGSLDKRALDLLMPALEREASDPDIGWLTHHLRARSALNWGPLRAASDELEDWLATSHELQRSDSLAFGRLHADLADLYQAAGRNRAAALVLASPTGAHLDPALHNSQVRQEILTGHPSHAIGMLGGTASLEGADNELRPHALSLYAAAVEATPSELVSTFLLDGLGRAIHRSGAFDAIVNLSDELRTRLATSFDPEYAGFVWPVQFPHSSMIASLTAREWEVFDALQLHSAVKDIAGMLHISTNTAKSHLRALYKKLAVHSRDEALQLRYGTSR